MLRCDDLMNGYHIWQDRDRFRADPVDFEGGSGEKGPDPGNPHNRP